jgi:hypothetical protein
MCLADVPETMPMSKPLVVTIPHRLGKDEAVRRLKAGIGQARTNFAQMMTVEEETWQDDHLTFHIRALAQAVSGTLAVAEDHATLEVQLPWLLHTIAEKARTMIQKQGHLMLEKK